MNGHVPMGLCFGEPEISPIQMRLEMMNAKNGLGLITPDFILPHFEYEPLCISDFIKPKANILKLRSIIRKAKQKI